MVGVSMRQENSRRTRILPEAFFRCADDHSRHSRQSRVNQYPIFIARAGDSKKRHIDHRQPFVGEVGQDFVRPIVAGVIQYRVIGPPFGVERNAMLHKFSLKEYLETLRGSAGKVAGNYAAHAFRYNAFSPDSG